jgi:uncharacterized membrane protein YidH (DUF202 family)
VITLAMGVRPLTEPAEKEPENLIIGEVQLILAEKRTSLAALRTGIAVFALPLSVLSVLVATSKYYEFVQVVHLILPLLIILGSYLVIRSIIRIRHQDRIILEIKRRHSRIAEFID